MLDTQLWLEYLTEEYNWVVLAHMTVTTLSGTECDTAYQMTPKPPTPHSFQKNT